MIVHAAVWTSSGRLVVGDGISSSARAGKPHRCRTPDQPGALDKIDEYTKIGMDEGARLLTGGRSPRARVFYRPTIFADVDPMRIAQEEIFGPTLR